MRTRKALAITVMSALALLGIATVYVVAAPDPASGPDSPRFRASVVLLALSDNRTSVERFASEHATLKGSARVLSAPAPSSYVGKVLISADGAMSVTDARGEFVVFLEPELANSSVQWRCSVVPEKFAPGPCRPK